VLKWQFFLEFSKKNTELYADFKSVGKFAKTIFLTKAMNKKSEK
jgi:hypothetical protein